MTARPVVAHLIHEFHEFELREDCFQRQTRGFRFWDYIRVPVFRRIAAARSVLPLQSEVTREGRLRSVARESLRFPSVVRQPFWSTMANTDLMFFPGGKALQTIDGRRVDFRVYPFVKAVVQSGPRVVVVSALPLNDRTDDAYPCSVVRWRHVVLGAHLKAKTFRLSHDEERTLQQLSGAIDRAFGVRPGMEAIFREWFARQYVTVPWLQRLYERLSPRLVGMLNDGRRKAVIQVARQCGIPTFEYQHGATSPIDIISSYPPEVTVEVLDTMPQTILTHGEYWNGKFAYPARRIAVGFPHLESCLESQRPQSQRDNVVVCASTGDPALARFVADAAGAVPAVEFLFKLRPNEQESGVPNYRELLGHAQNVRILAGDRPTLYDLMSTVRWLLSINSTALWEAAAFGCSPLVLTTGQFEDAADLIEGGHAFAVDRPDQVADIVRARRLTKPIASTELYARGSVTRIGRTIAELLAEGK